LGDNVNTAKNNTETLLGASRDVGLEINAERTKCMIMSHHPYSGQNQNMRIANESFQNVAEFEYLEMTQIRMTFMMNQEQIKFWECLVSFSPKSLVFPSHFRKAKE
jgi:hypothetical protein